ncbi:septum site-determining protein MinC [Legionella fairfieldensis]|uniref:septum site-determining protein MinC n=1 Tax=Legionella fairfieldensis TaxID=45064 RepID=UPI00048F2DF6|nr:septum site-determining protein MinC [Legionella fairfieldensis]
MVDNVLKSQTFKLKGRLYTLTVMQLLSGDCVQFEQNLEELVAKAPRFFDKTPIILDCSALPDVEFDLQIFFQCMRKYNLLPVAIQGANPFLATLAQCQGIAVLNSSSAHDKLLVEENAQEQVVTEPIRTKLQMAPVRSGQQVVSKGGDLVITASVSHGAELLADGNIHVYGTLRGRALAGISGDTQARIFCQSLDAELVSIAGFYRLSDAIESHAGPCQIYLENEHINVEPLC